LAFPCQLSLSAKSPSGFCTCARAVSFLGESLAPWILTPRVARAAHWWSLNQDVPTSDVLFHRTGTTHRLQAALSLPFHVLQRAPDLPAWSEPPPKNPVKGKSKTIQDAFHRIERSFRHFTYGTIQSAPCSLTNSCANPHTRSPSLPPPSASVSTGYSVFSDRRFRSG